MSDSFWKMKLLDFYLWVAELQFQKPVYRFSTGCAVGQCRLFLVFLRKLVCWRSMLWLRLPDMYARSAFNPRSSLFLLAKAISSLFVGPTYEQRCCESALLLGSVLTRACGRLATLTLGHLPRSPQDLSLGWQDGWDKIAELASQSVPSVLPRGLASVSWNLTIDQWP